MTALQTVARRLVAAVARPLEDPAARRQTAEGVPRDAIVVLGAPLHHDRLPPVAAERVRVAVDLWRRGLAPVICAVGGHCTARAPSRSHERSHATEAEGMARWMRAAGVPEDALRVDRLSTSTRTNAERAAELLLPEGRRRVWVVTQPFHLRRACWWLRRCGLEPAAWRIDDGLQERDLAAALRWTAREYAAWAKALVLAG